MKNIRKLHECHLLQHFSFFLFLLSYSSQIASSSSSGQLCQPDQSSALLQLKQEFIINKLWKAGSDCCYWDGVTCDEDTGNVVGLDLRSSGIYSTMYSNSSLFRLYQLQRLNLGDNNFRYSQIPSAFGWFTRLTHLDLSSSVFSGQVPLEISWLTKLVSLDLTCDSDITQLKLENPSLKTLVQNLSGLRKLHLAAVKISSGVPDLLANLSYLESLDLSECELYGNFPVNIFLLPNLHTLIAELNPGLTGFLPEFHSGSSLKILALDNTGFSGNLPKSFGNLNLLNTLYLGYCSFSGSAWSWLGNLTQLTKLWLSNNNFSGQILPSLANLTKLTLLELQDNHFGGQIPSSLGDLNKIIILNLSQNNFEGQIPSSLANLTQLSVFILSHNQLTGPIPSLFALPKLAYIDLSRNQLNGTVEIGMLGKRKKLEFLDLSYNNLSLITDNSIKNSTSVGPLPVPPPSIIFFSVSNNNLSGEIPPVICSFKSLKILDLSHNRFSGLIPHCLGEDFYSLMVLNLRRNNFQGTFSIRFTEGSSLRMLDVNGNQLEGQVPQSLIYCTWLEVLNLGSNHINDTFPYWLETLPYLSVLVLRSNKFHGPIGHPQADLAFPKLRIIDLSYNDFVGHLPSEYFQHWDAMKKSDINDSKLEYMGNDYYEASVTITYKGQTLDFDRILTIFVSIDMSNNRFRGEIPESIRNFKSLRGLNFSHNRLTGCIPKSFGNLTALESLDLSQNELSGEIPWQLASLTFLAVLNLSQNHLMGPIPQGSQFNTFLNTSFGGNLGLCGFPLSRTCGDAKLAQPPTLAIQQSTFEFDWKIMLMGYECGTVIGVVIGHIFFWWKKELFMWIVEAREFKQRNRLKKRSLRCKGGLKK